MKVLKLFFLVIAVLLARPSFTQDVKEKKLTKKVSGLRFFQNKDKNYGFAGTPLFFFTPETRIAFGVSTVFYFRNSKKDSLIRPSVLHPFLGYTQNHQSFIEVPFQLFFKQEKYYLYGELAFYQYPYKFFGVGNQQPDKSVLNYTSTYPSCSLSVLRKISPKYYLGFRYNFDYYKITFQDTSNALYQQSFTGKKGGLNNGIGLQFLYDSRDNIFSTHKGSYIEFMSVFDSKKITLSDYNYQWFMFDIRKFISFKRDNIIAMEYYINIISGNPPFYQMALLGGDHRMRGYYEGRYRDKNYTTTQVEYRSPFWRNRLGFATFAGTGLVFPNLGQFDLRYLKTSIGGGLRFRFNRKEKINFRADIAYGQSFNYYFVLSEAF